MARSSGVGYWWFKFVVVPYIDHANDPSDPGNIEVDDDADNHDHDHDKDDDHDRQHHLVIDDVEGEDADGVDVLLVAPGPEPPVVTKGWVVQ